MKVEVVGPVYRVHGCRTWGPVTELASQGDRCWTAADLNACIQITAVIRFVSRVTSCAVTHRTSCS